MRSKIENTLKKNVKKLKKIARIATGKVHKTHIKGLNSPKTSKDDYFQNDSVTGFGKPICFAWYSDLVGTLRFKVGDCYCEVFASFQKGTSAQRKQAKTIHSLAV